MEKKNGGGRLPAGDLCGKMNTAFPLCPSGAGAAGETTPPVFCVYFCINNKERAFAMRVSPSLLTCDFTCLRQEMARVESWGADRLHLDVMDGEFVPSISFGASVIRALRPLTKLPFDVHLMTQHPHRQLNEMARAGADMVTIHLECDSPLRETLASIREYGLRAGLAIRPGTPLEAIYPYLDLIDMALVMTVEPGRGGQRMLPQALPRAAALHRAAAARRVSLEIEVDGGVNAGNLQQVADMGANAVVMGSALFGNDEAGQLVRLAQKLRPAENPPG